VNEHGWYDAGQAVGFLTLQATTMGLAVRQMEGFDHARASAVCRVPPSFETGVVMAIGFAADPSSLPTAQREAEQRPRSRRPIGEFVFEARWDRPFQ
jgi:hypothetical protein